MTSHRDQMRAQLTAKSVTVANDYHHCSMRNPDDPWTGSTWGRGTDEIFASISLEGADF
jgi:hypothetical protein